MGKSRTVKLVGVVDGVNCIFYTAHPAIPYKTGSAILGGYDNATRLRDDDDGWTETSPGAGEITFKEAPEGTGPVWLTFEDTTADAPAGFIVSSFTTELNGRLQMRRGMSWERTFTAVDELGNALDLTGATAYLTIKDRALDSTMPLLALVSTSGSLAINVDQTLESGFRGQITPGLVPTDTIDIEDKRTYFLDIQVWLQDGRLMPVFNGAVDLLPRTGTPPWTAP